MTTTRTATAAEVEALVGALGLSASVAAELRAAGMPLERLQDLYTAGIRATAHRDAIARSHLARWVDVQNSGRILNAMFPRAAGRSRLTWDDVAAAAYGRKPADKKRPPITDHDLAVLREGEARHRRAADEGALQ